MDEIKSIGFALDPSNVPTFLLDWEVTKKCNLDCSYCPVGVEWGGHDNSTQHPALQDCLRSIDFMYEYVDLYMQYKKSTQRKVVLNVYGGESLFHPNIIEILENCREKYSQYKDKWELTITTTTNAVVNKSIWKKIVPLVDEFTVSYHAENLKKQEKLFFENLLFLKENNKRVKCIILMHNDKILWEKSLRAKEFCQDNNIKYMLKPLETTDRNYSVVQFDYMKSYWQDQTSKNQAEGYKKLLNKPNDQEEIVSICQGKSCCGGRKLSLNNNLKSSVVYVPKQGFKNWYCSVNWFFLFVQQITGDVYTNKDCRTSLDNKVERLGNINNYQEITRKLKYYLDTKTLPVIQCVKDICICGYCAPKARDLDDFKNLIQRHTMEKVILFK